MIEFEWDPYKANDNRRDHRVTFEEASTVFGDVLSAIAPDPDHSDDEDRYVIVGISRRQRLLLVSFTDRNGRVRIISARELTAYERREWENDDF